MTRTRGFTIIEVLIVLAIVGIVLAIIAGAVTKPKKGAPIPAAQRDEVPSNFKYEGRFSYADVYTFTTSNGARCVIVKYTDPVMSCEWSSPQ